MLVKSSERVWRTTSARPSTQSPTLAGATKSKVMLTVGRNLRSPTSVPPPIVPTRSATGRIAHVPMHAKAQHELVARALLAALGVERADMAVESRLRPVTIEID